MSRTLYQKGSYIIFRVSEGYIVYNTVKPFKQGHTHIKNFNTAKYLINLSKGKIIPNRLSLYLWVSLERISTNKLYCRKIRHIIDELRIEKENKR